MVSAIAPFSLGVLCLILAVKLRKGLGSTRVSRGVSVNYDEIPLEARVRASNANLVIAPAFLAIGVFCLAPVPLILIPIGIVLISLYPYFLRHKELQDAAKPTLRAAGKE